VNGRMFSTVDAGHTWRPFNQPIRPLPDGKLANFCFEGGGQTGWIVGGMYRVVLRTDETGPGARYARVGFKDQGLASAIFSTSDFGKTWQRQRATMISYGRSGCRAQCPCDYINESVEKVR
jgi:hypothetical protein